MAENKTITKLREALENLVTLEIITAVGKVKFPPPNTGNQPHDDHTILPDIDYEQPSKTILSKINLLQGDIKTVFDSEFVTGEYAALREFHAEREKQGHDIIKENIKAIKELVDLIINFPKAT